MTDWKTVPLRSGSRMAYEVDRVVVHRQTAFQVVEIIDTVAFGRALFLDNDIQSALSDEFIYHEALVHPALVAHPAPRQVFIAGGGEGATLREVLRHNTVERVVMVDIDAEVVALCREHMPELAAGAFDDPRVELVHADARAYLQDRTDTYDCIIVDITAPFAGGPSYLLFTREFYALVHDRLTSDGVVVTQAQSSRADDLTECLAIAHTLAQVFPTTFVYEVFPPSFGEPWAFALGTKGRPPTALDAVTVDRVLQERGVGALRFYDGVLHEGLFATPKYIRDALQRFERVITDADPLRVKPLV